MAFCSNCGTEMKEDANFCPSCGKAAEKAEDKTEFIGNDAKPQAEQNGSQQSGEQSTAGTAPAGNDFSAKFNAYTKTEDKTASFETADISDNKVYAILAYIGILVLVPIIAAPKSKFARFHANQGLVLLIGEAAYAIIRGVLLAVLKAVLGINIHFWMNPVISVVYGVISAATGLLALVFVVLAVIGIINAAQGQAKELPVISKFKILK